MTAVVIISDSEIAKVLPDWHYEFPLTNPEEFSKMLWELGINTTQPVEKQEGFLHRNRFNETVLCNRWVGYERLDKEWIDSGYASRDARNEASQSRMLKDILSYKIPSEVLVAVSTPNDYEEPEEESED
jgi:hypothetical protein